MIPFLYNVGGRRTVQWMFGILVFRFFGHFKGLNANLKVKPPSDTFCVEVKSGKAFKTTRHNCFPLENCLEKVLLRA